MADIELVVKINENTYHRFINGFADEDDATLIEELFKNGAPLTESDDCINRKALCDYIAEFVNNEYSTQAECDMVDAMIDGIQHLPSVNLKTDAFDKIKWLIEQYESEIEKCAEDRRNMSMSPTQAYLTAKIGVYGKVIADLKELIESEGDNE